MIFIFVVLMTFFPRKTWAILCSLFKLSPRFPRSMEKLSPNKRHYKARARILTENKAKQRRIMADCKLILELQLHALGVECRALTSDLECLYFHIIKFSLIKSLKILRTWKKDFKNAARHFINREKLCSWWFLWTKPEQSRAWATRQ